MSVRAARWWPSAEGARLLDVVYGLHARLEFRGQTAEQQHRQRPAHAKAADEMHDALINAAGLRRGCIDVGGCIDDGNLLAVEHSQRLRAVAALAFDAQLVGTAQRDLAGLVELDLLAGFLHGVVAGAQADAVLVRAAR